LVVKGQYYYRKTGFLWCQIRKNECY
jgi:hypothetical protein